METPDTEGESVYWKLKEQQEFYRGDSEKEKIVCTKIIEDIISSRDTYWKERVDRAFVILDTNIQELVTYEEGRVSKESVLTCVRRIKRELDNLK